MARPPGEEDAPPEDPPEEEPPVAREYRGQEHNWIYEVVVGLFIILLIVSWLCYEVQHSSRIRRVKFLPFYRVVDRKVPQCAQQVLIGIGMIATMIQRSHRTPRRKQMAK
jgi:hypothetical protein